MVVCEPHCEFACSGMGSTIVVKMLTRFWQILISYSHVVSACINSMSCILFRMAVILNKAKLNRMAYVPFCSFMVHSRFLRAHFPHSSYDGC